MATQRIFFAGYHLFQWDEINRPWMVMEWDGNFCVVIGWDGKFLVLGWGMGWETSSAWMGWDGKLLVLGWDGI